MPGRYRLIERVGFGGYGEVWRSEDMLNHKEVALKFLHTISLENLQALRREAEMYIQEQSNPHVLRLLEWNFNVGSPFLVLEFCRWGTLRSWVPRNWYDVARALQSVALGLGSIHNKGGFHRDIKPDNLFLSESPIRRKFIIKIGDFGLCRIPLPLMNSWMTCTAQGTPEYMAPELSRGANFTANADIYSLGITGIELITGSRRRESIERVWIISSDFRSLLLQMTSEDPDERPDARAVANCIGRFLREYDCTVKTAFSVGAIVGSLWFLSTLTKK